MAYAINLKVCKRTSLSLFNGSTTQVVAEPVDAQAKKRLNLNSICFEFTKGELSRIKFSRLKFDASGGIPYSIFAAFAQYPDYKDLFLGKGARSVRLFSIHQYELFVFNLRGHEMTHDDINKFLATFFTILKDNANISETTINRITEHFKAKGYLCEAKADLDKTAADPIKSCIETQWFK